MDANIETKHFLTKEQAGLYACGASRATIDRWIKDGLPGKLPPPARTENWKACDD